MSKKVLFEGKFLRLIDNDGWEYVERINSDGVVAIVALTEDSKVILIEQFRPPIGKQVIEFPAGLVNDLDLAEEETFLDAATREFFEETGYEAEKLVKIASGPLGAGMSTSHIELFRAYGLKKVGDGGGDETENISVHEVPIEEVQAWLDEKQKQGIGVDPKVYAGLYFLLQS